jgi:hypothetical protein
MRRAPPRALALALTLQAACLDDRRSSDGSELEGPIVWMANEQSGRSLSPGGLPPDALSVTLMASAAGGHTIALGVRDAAGRVLVDAAAPEQSANRLLRGRDLVVGMIPSATGSLPLATNFEVSAARLDGAAAEPFTFSAWIKRGPVPAVQELPLALVLVAPVERPSLAAALAEVRRIWRPAGIEIGDPVVVEVGGAEAERLARVEVDPALGADTPLVVEALRLSGRAPARALALLVVGDVALAGAESSIWALAGGIPVPPVTGTARSGVLVSALLVARDPTFAGQVIAHEIGHALGLYHTTEQSLDGQAIHDQIDDTPADDASNLMFWSAVRGRTHLTPGQAEIARRSALAR